MHHKVDKRMYELNWIITPPTEAERKNWSIWLNNLSRKYYVSISACSVPGLPESKCIDGKLLQKLHPLNRPTRLDEPRHRALCGCTFSIDIGGWPPKKCFTGCQYCYANAQYINLLKTT